MADGPVTHFSLHIFFPRLVLEGQLRYVVHNREPLWQATGCLTEANLE